VTAFLSQISQPAHDHIPIEMDDTHVEGGGAWQVLDESVIVL